jgi:hypothetical protein
MGQIYLISERQAWTARQYLRCIKHFASVWNTYIEALYKLKCKNKFLHEKRPAKRNGTGTRFNQTPFPVHPLTGPVISDSSVDEALLIRYSKVLQ